MWRDTYILLKFSTQIVDLVKVCKIGQQRVLFFLLTEIAFKEDVAGDGCSVLTHKHHGDTNRVFPIDTGLAVQRHFPLRDKRDLFPAWYFSLTSSAVGQKMSLLGFCGSCSSSSIQKAPLALEKEMLSVPFPLFLSCHLSRLVHSGSS